MLISEYEKLNPVYTKRINEKEIRFHTPTVFTHWRAKTFLTKEPCTIDWINSMGDESYLLDVGANMGVYSIYAALIRGLRVTAVEPEVSNASLLKKNILLNALTENIDLWAVGLGDRNGIQPLYVNDLRLAGSCHSLGEELDFNLVSKKFKTVQYVYGTTIDAIVNQKNKTPTHIKIDVDGLEHKVINGALNTLRNPQLISLCVELNLNLEEHREIITLLGSYDFHYDVDQVKRALRSDGPFKGVGEHIFVRT